MVRIATQPQRIVRFWCTQVHPRNSEGKGCQGNESFFVELCAKELSSRDPRSLRCLPKTSFSLKEPPPTQHSRAKEANHSLHFRQEGLSRDQQKYVQQSPLRLTCSLRLSSSLSVFLPSLSTFPLFFPSSPLFSSPLLFPSPSHCHLRLSCYLVNICCLRVQRML